MCAHDDFQQSDVFRHCGASSLLDAAVEGMKVTILAYGATGSGKTHTIIGEDGGDIGLIERSAKYLFETKRSGLRLVASCYEVYSENVYDLLNASKTPLPVRHNTTANAFFVPGLVELECHDACDVAAIVAEGRRARRRAAHKLNRDSSRGHALLSCKLVTSSGHQLGKVTFVDLAGNERLGRSQTENATETGSINRSLFALGKVISALARTHPSTSQVDDASHVPYRDSTLTKLLMDSLGGDVFTLMIACVSPAPAHLDETLCTLQYAFRAKGIHNAPTVQLVSASPLSSEGDTATTTRSHESDEMLALRRENARLREENRRLRAMQGTASEPPSTRDDNTWSMYRQESRERGAYETRHSARSRVSGSSRSSETPAARAATDQQRVDYLDSKIDRLQEHFSSLEAKLDAANTTKAEVDSLRHNQEQQQQQQQQWHQAQWNAALATQQQQEHAMLFHHHHKQQQQQQQQQAHMHAALVGGTAIPQQDFYSASYGMPPLVSHDTPYLAQHHEKREESAQGQQHRRLASPSDDHLCAVHRQSSGDVVRRHREGILGI
ncbi:hypothetical protein CTAYLR_000406 [Chrysophaeum taylorii]|uniref:Kinesin-like protein n=1 Tax=Chrysophaeum taylorii TaxID=2483200 RepID=A0AAD7XN03_9STRA|nr:hypothetical protein CTAYLR_000406 [Chrysophaeum taylorii]